MRGGSTKLSTLQKGYSEKATLEDIWWLFGGWLKGVFRVSAVCLNGVWRTSGGLWWVSGCCLEGGRKVSGLYEGCLEGVALVSPTCLIS